MNKFNAKLYVRSEGGNACETVGRFETELTYAERGGDMAHEALTKSFNDQKECGVTVAAPYSADVVNAVVEAVHTSIAMNQFDKMIEKNPERAHALLKKAYEAKMGRPLPQAPGGEFRCATCGAAVDDQKAPHDAREWGCPACGADVLFIKQRRPRDERQVAAEPPAKRGIALGGLKTGGTE